MCSMVLKSVKSVKMCLICIRCTPLWSAGDDIGFNSFIAQESTAGLLTTWRHQMEAFSALLALCAGNSPVTGEFPAQRPVTRGFDVFFDLCLNKRLSKQSWGWWFQMPLRSLWRHCNYKTTIYICVTICFCWMISQDQEMTRRSQKYKFIITVYSHYTVRSQGQGRRLRIRYTQHTGSVQLNDPCKVEIKLRQ